MSQVTQLRKKTYVKKAEPGIKKVSEGHYVVRSDRYLQLWYTVRLSDNDMYCACDYFRYKKACCKHLLRIMAIDQGANYV